jgi:hypothetical protein
MLIRFFHTMLILAAVAGYAADAIVCYQERAETHCTTEHGNTSDRHHECNDCVCHMSVDVSPESTGTVLQFDKVDLISKENSPIYSLVIPPDLQPPRLS